MKKYNHFMLDLETLGNTSNAAVVQIGVVGFDPATSETSPPSRLYVRAHPKSQIDESTVKWWMGQSDEARKSVFRDNEDKLMEPETATYRLSEMFNDWAEDEKFRVWSKPSTFDIVILESLYKNCDRQVPWKHWNTRCLRTLIDMAKLTKAEEAVPEIAHDAGYDALAQAQTAIKCMKKLDNGNA